MSEDDQELVPALHLKDLPINGESLKIKLDCAKPVKSGTNGFGEWFMWFGFIENFKVWEGRGKESKPIEKYSGKVIFFPTTKVNGALTDLAKGNVGVEVSIKKEVYEGVKGLVKTYKVEKLSEGSPLPSSLTPSEIRLLDDTAKVVSAGIGIDEASFVRASQSEEYKNITETRARELYAIFKEKNE